MSRLLRQPPYGDGNLLVWAPGRQMGWHGHDFLQCIHVLGGCLEIDWGEGWRQLRAGQVHVLPPGHQHRLRSPRGQRQFGLNCSRQGDERGLLALLLATFDRPCVLELAAPAWVAGLGSDDALEPLARLDLLQRLDAYLCELVARRRGPADAADRLLARLRELAEGPCTVSEVAADLGMGRATMQRICRRRFGCGVAHLHERLRLERAAQRLMAEDLDLASCAAASGYGDVYAFSRAFRRVMGMPPGRWRDEHRARFA